LSKLAEMRAKFSEIRQKAASAIEDVPDTLIGTILVLILLTMVGMGSLMIFGFLATTQ